jgi:hypothetical protein
MGSETLPGGAKIVAAIVAHGEGGVTAALAPVIQSERAALSAR